MKKTSLFILLILLTFSLSKSNIKLHFQSKQAYIGINIIYSFEKDYIYNKMNLSKEIKEKIKNDLIVIDYSDKTSGGADSIISYPNKREIRINSYHLEAEVLKIREDMALYFIYYYDVIIEKPPKYERKCENLGIVKKCKNVEVNQTFTLNELKEIQKEIFYKMAADAFVDLTIFSKEDYEKYKQILSLKFPQNKNLK